MRSIIICYYIIRSYDIEINRLVILFGILVNSHFCNDIIEENRERLKNCFYYYRMLFIYNCSWMQF